MEMQNMEIAQNSRDFKGVWIPMSSNGSNTTEVGGSHFQKGEGLTFKRDTNTENTNREYKQKYKERKKERKKEILFKENGKYSHNVYTLCDPECPDANAKIKFKNEE